MEGPRSHIGLRGQHGRAGLPVLIVVAAVSVFAWFTTSSPGGSPNNPTTTSTADTLPAGTVPESTWVSEAVPGTEADLGAYVSCGQFGTIPQRLCGAWKNLSQLQLQMFSGDFGDVYPVSILHSGATGVAKWCEFMTLDANHDNYWFPLDRPLVSSDGHWIWANSEAEHADFSCWAYIG